MINHAISRRNALTGALAMLCQSGIPAVEGQTSQAQGPVFQHDLPDLTLQNWAVTVIEVDIPPGQGSGPHRHPGFVLAYVLTGAVVTEISGQPKVTYAAGQMFYEPPGSTHLVSRNASGTEPAKLLALIFAKKGLPLTVPA